MQVYDLVFNIKLNEEEVRITQNNDGVQRMWCFKDYEDPYHAIDELRYALDILLESHVAVLISAIEKLRAQEHVDADKAICSDGKDDKYDVIQ